MGIIPASSVNDNLFHDPEPLKIWPVPVSQILNIERNTMPLPGDELIITDSSGRVVFRDIWNNSVDVGRLLPGIYMIKLRSGNRPAATAKFLKTG
jgi:hypothetical protein